MKKLSVVLLAILFIFGFAVQASADVESGLDEMAFEGDYKITFDKFAADINCPDDFVLIENQYWETYGVSFSGGLYGEDWLGTAWMHSGVTAANYNYCNFYYESSPRPAITVTFDPPATRVGFNGMSPYGDIIVKVFSGDVVTELEPIFASSKTFIGIRDTEGIEKIEISGTGLVIKLLGGFFIDDFQFGREPESGPADVEVKVNIKPPNCLGARIPINAKSNGVTPVVIIGDETGSYDVAEIIPETVRLQGVEPVRWAIEDASHCQADQGDGTLDLTLKFDTHDLVEAIKDSLPEGETLQDGDMVHLHLTGNLVDDTPIREEENTVSVTVLVKGKH